MPDNNNTNRKKLSQDEIDKILEKYKIINKAASDSQKNKRNNQLSRIIK